MNDKQIMTPLTLSQTIEKVEQMIDTAKGDPGRLYHILESLKNNKTLYHSDQVYLESKLNSEFSIHDEPNSLPKDLLDKISFMIDSGLGDAGRLQHIHDMILNNKTLYHSDQKYLESKLEAFTGKVSYKSTQTLDSKTTSSTIPTYEKEANYTKNEINDVTTKLSDKLRGSMPKDWIPPSNTSDLIGIYEKIKTEEQRLNEQKHIHDEINLQRSKLSQLILNRQEYEKQVKLEQSKLEIQIKEEREKISNQTHLSEEIHNQRKELEMIKLERDKVLRKISDEKTRISKELEKQKHQLVQAQLEQDEIEKQIQREKSILAKMTLEQKDRLLRQAQFAHEIKQKQFDLEKSKQEYEEIVSQVNQEKEKLIEAEKLEKSIKSQEQDLINAKEERLKLITLISKEKEAISKKTLEEKQKLMSQSLFADQLKKEEKIYEKLKQKREKLEEKIKIKNKKIKEKQELVKKQISEKDKKLKSLVRKSAKKPTSKLPKNN